MKLDYLQRPVCPAWYGALCCDPRTDSTRSDGRLVCASCLMEAQILSHQNGQCTQPPRRVAELGPGDSIGIGLAPLAVPRVTIAAPCGRIRCEFEGR